MIDKVLPNKQDFCNSKPQNYYIKILPTFGGTTSSIPSEFLLSYAAIYFSFK